MVREVTLNGNMIEEWSTVIEQGSGNAARLCRSTAALILNARVPHVHLELVHVRPRGLFRSTAPRGYLRVSHARLKSYFIYIGAQDFGTFLKVEFFVTHEPDFLAVFFGGGSLNFLEKGDLDAHTSIIRRLLVKATEELLLTISQNASELVDSKAKGFLGVST